MKSRALTKLSRATALSIAVLFCVAGLPAQTTSGTLHGQVTDPSGAAVPSATVVVTSDSGHAATAISGRDGGYEVPGLAPGTYTVTVSAKGFQEFNSDKIQIAAGQTQKLDLPLTIEEEHQKVEVQAEGGAQLSVSPENNASAVVISGKDLDELSDDPDQLQSDLAALAGASGGPNGGQMYIDGFTAGQVPPESSIREIRINQNPFSAEYDKLGYGRIEIFTKPGTDQFHGQSSINTTESVFNARNPFITTSVPPYYSLEANENVGGPLGKKASLFFNADYRNIDDQSVLSILNPPAGTPATEANPRKRLNIGPRLDYQLTKKNTFSIRY